MGCGIRLLVVVVFVCGPARMACSDGGQVRLSETYGDYQVAVFTSPTPMRAGPIDVSVLVQQTSTGAVATDGDIVIDLRSRQQTGLVIRATATTAAATNKLFRAAKIELPSPGWWDVRVRCAPQPSVEPFELHFSMLAASRLPDWLTLWPWFGWPIVVVVLFAVHRYLVSLSNQRGTRTRAN